MEIHAIQFGDSLGQLFEWVFAIQKLAISVLDMASLCEGNTDNKATTQKDPQD